MTTKPTDLAAVDAAEDAHVEACTGDQIRAALAPFVPHLRDASPDSAQELLGATGYGWICNFAAPTRFGWAGKRYPQPVHAQLVALLDQLDALQVETAEAYRAAIGADPFAEPIAQEEPRLRRPAPMNHPLGGHIFDPRPPMEPTE